MRLNERAYAVRGYRRAAAPGGEDQQGGMRRKMRLAGPVSGAGVGANFLRGAGLFGGLHARVLPEHQTLAGEAVLHAGLERRDLSAGFRRLLALASRSVERAS